MDGNDQCLAVVKKLKKKYKEVFEVGSELKPMKGRPVVLEVKDNVKVNPIHVCTPRKTAYALVGSAQETLEEYERLGVTRRVNEPTDWVSPCQFVPKKNGGARLVADLVRLNKSIKRKVHPFTPAKDLLALIPSSARFFAVFDCKHGYWQIEVDEKSQLLLTFLTEWGTFCYRRLPMGLICSGDIFCERTDHALVGLVGILKLVDDILVFADTIPELEQRIEKLFRRCFDHNITLADDKVQAGTGVILWLYCKWK